MLLSRKYEKKKDKKSEMIFDNLKTLLSKYRKIIFVYVFGSFIDKDKEIYNDVDIAIYIASDKMDTYEYLNLKRELMDITNTEIDIVILNDANPLIKNEIFKEGIRLFSRNNEIESDFIVHSLFEYEDMKKYYDLSYQAMIERNRKEVEGNGENRDS